MSKSNDIFINWKSELARDVFWKSIGVHELTEDFLKKLLNVNQNKCLRYLRTKHGTYSSAVCFYDDDKLKSIDFLLFKIAEIQQVLLNFDCIQNYIKGLDGHEEDFNVQLIQIANMFHDLSEKYVRMLKNKKELLRDFCTQLVENSIITAAAYAELVSSAVSEDFVTSADSEDIVTAAVSAEFVTSADPEGIITAAVSADLVSSAVSEDYVTSAVSENIITAAASAELLSSAVSEDFVTSDVSEDIVTAAVSAEFVTSANSEGVITAAVSAELVSSAVSEGFITAAVSAEFINSADPEGVITAAVSAEFINSADPEDFITAAVSAEFINSADPEGVITATVFAKFVSSAVSEDFVTSTVSEDVVTETVSEDFITAAVSADFVNTEFSNKPIPADDFAYNSTAADSADDLIGADSANYSTSSEYADNSTTTDPEDIYINTGSVDISSAAHCTYLIIAASARADTERIFLKDNNVINIAGMSCETLPIADPDSVRMKLNPLEEPISNKDTPRADNNLDYFAEFTEKNILVQDEFDGINICIPEETGQADLNLTYPSAESNEMFANGTKDCKLSTASVCAVKLKDNYQEDCTDECIRRCTRESSKECTMKCTDEFVISVDNCKDKDADDSIIINTENSSREDCIENNTCFINHRDSIEFSADLLGDVTSDLEFDTMNTTLENDVLIDTADISIVSKDEAKIIDQKKPDVFDTFLVSENETESNYDYERSNTEAYVVSSVADKIAALKADHHFTTDIVVNDSTCTSSAICEVDIFADITDDSVARITSCFAIKCTAVCVVCPETESKGSMNDNMNATMKTWRDVILPKPEPTDSPPPFITISLVLMEV